MCAVIFLSAQSLCVNEFSISKTRKYCMSFLLSLIYFTTKRYLPAYLQPKFKTAELNLKFFMAGKKPVRRDRRFQFVGCFRDKHRRALPVRIMLLRGVYRGFGLVNRCGRIALRKGYRVFSVQNHNECWSGRNAHKTYGRYGRRRGCSHWTGTAWGNDVYRIRGGELDNRGLVYTGMNVLLGSLLSKESSNSCY